jgi:hypothetical protein
LLVSRRTSRGHARLDQVDKRHNGAATPACASVQQ